MNWKEQKNMNSCHAIGFTKTGTDPYHLKHPKTEKQGDEAFNTCSPKLKGYNSLPLVSNQPSTGKAHYKH